MINVRNFCTIVFCTVCFTACNKPPEADDCFIAAILQERIHKDVQWARDCYAHESIDYTVQCLIDEPLTADSAVQIALLKNPNIQAAFEEIGIAQADLVEAGLLSNPIFEAIVRYPDKSGFNTNPEFSLTQNFIDILLMPLRVKVATAEFEKIKLQVAHTILLIAFDVERVYYSLVAAQKRKELLNNIVDLSEIGNEIAQAQRKAGNINLLNMQLRTSEYLTRVAELGEASAEIIHQRERLNRLLGLSGSEICWSVSSSLPFIPDSEPCFESLEQLAFEERLDLQAAKWEVERLNRIFPTVQWWSFTKLYAGASSTREPSIGSPWTTGPAFAGEIPIFNYGQGTRKDCGLNSDRRATGLHLWKLMPMPMFAKLATNLLSIVSRRFSMPAKCCLTNKRC